MAFNMHPDLTLETHVSKGHWLHFHLTWWACCYEMAFVLWYGLQHHFRLNGLREEEVNPRKGGQGRRAEEKKGVRKFVKIGSSAWHCPLDSTPPVLPHLVLSPPCLLPYLVRQVWWQICWCSCGAAASWGSHFVSLFHWGSHFMSLFHCDKAFHSTDQSWIGEGSSQRQ